MTGAEILAGFEAIGARVRLTPAGVVDVDAPAVPELERLVAAVKANRSDVVTELRRHAVTEHPCVSCGAAADAEALYCAPCWETRRGRLLAFDEVRARRLEERAERTAAVLAERHCEACGFSFWRVSSRGDARCYPCELLRDGRPLRCARCGGEEWRRDEHGHAECSTCAGGDARVAAPSAIVSPEPTSEEIPEGGGAG